MNVLTVAHRMPFYGGAELVIVRLAEYMAKVGIHNTVVAPGAPRRVVAELAQAGAVVELTGGKNTLEQYYRLHSRVQELIRHVDVVNVHNFPTILTVPPVHKPVVWMCNEPPEVFRGKGGVGMTPLLWLNRWALAHYCTLAVVADRYNEERFRRYYGFQPSIIPYGIDYGFWSHGERVPHDSFNIVQVGTVTRLKNQLETLQAAADLVKKQPLTHVYLVGDDRVEPDYTDELKQFVKDTGIELYVTFTGHISREEVRTYYKTADALVHPIKDQGGWLTPFEAIAAGVPDIIVSERATCSQMISDNLLGYVFSDGHLPELLDLVLASAPVGTERSRNWVREHLTWEQFGKSFTGLLKSAIVEFATRKCQKEGV